MSKKVEKSGKGVGFIFPEKRENERENKSDPFSTTPFPRDPCLTALSIAVAH